MDNSMFGFMDIILLFAGLYVAYQWFNLKFRGEIMTGILLNKDVRIASCKDREGYMKEAAPVLFILMVGTLVTAGLSLINTFVTPIPSFLTWGSLLIFVVIIFWVGVKGKELHRKYWTVFSRQM